MANERGLTNVKFFPLQSYEALPALLKMGDCHLVVQKRGAADAVLPSKLTNILAVGGNAVITAEAETELGQLCDSYPGIAVCVEPESVPALVTGIERALAMPKRTRWHVNMPNARSRRERAEPIYCRYTGINHESNHFVSGCDGRWLW